MGFRACSSLRKAKVASNSSETTRKQKACAGVVLEILSLGLYCVCVCVCVCVSIYLFMCIYIYMYLSIYLSIYLSLNLSVYLSKCNIGSLTHGGFTNQGSTWVHLQPAAGRTADGPAGPANSSAKASDVGSSLSLGLLLVGHPSKTGHQQGNRNVGN